LTYKLIMKDRIIKLVQWEGVLLGGGG
jgi:hypothetical protein